MSLNYSMIIPVYNRGDILQEMLFSIPENELPQKLLIVDNSIESGDKRVKDVIEKSLKSEFFRNTEILWYKSPTNLGVSASWNLGLRTMPSPWIIANFDIFLEKGVISNYLEFLKEYDIVTLNNGGYILLGLNQIVVNKVGFFDENFWPAYVEDTDYDYRVKLAGLSKKNVLDIVKHQRSSTIYSDRNLLKLTEITTGMNIKYYEEKWGPRWEETYKNPFNDSANDISYWRFDSELVKKKKRIWNEILRGHIK